MNKLELRLSVEDLKCNPITHDCAHPFDIQNRDDLETAEFLFWPKLFFAKAALSKPWVVTKTVQVDTTPVKYSYKPVTYTAYKWVPVPYQVRIWKMVCKLQYLSNQIPTRFQYTVQQPYVDTSSSVSSTSGSTSGAFTASSVGTPSSGTVAVRAPFVNVDVVKGAGE